METTWLVNGRDTHVDPSDRGLAYGDGLFETMAVRNGHIRWLDRHLDRLERDCARLGFGCPERSLLESEILAGCPQTERGVAKLIVTRGPGVRGYGPPLDPVPTRILSFSAWPPYPESHYTQGIDMQTLAIRLGENPALAGMKHLNRLEQVLAQAELRTTGANEGLLLSSGSSVVGGTMSNIFMVRRDQISTPKLDRCGVCGVMRDIVLEQLAEYQDNPIERPIRIEELRQADELFVTNAVFGIWPVRSLDGRWFEVGRTTQRIMESLQIGSHA